MQQLCFAITVKAMEIDGNISYHRRCSKIASLSLPTPTKPVGRASVRVLENTSPAPQKRTRTVATAQKGNRE